MGQYLGKICFIEPKEVNGHRRHVPGAPISSMPREGQAKFRDGPCGDCRRILWVPGPWGQYSGKFVLSTKLGYKTNCVAIWLNVVLTPESKFRYGT